MKNIKLTVLRPNKLLKIFFWFFFTIQLGIAQKAETQNQTSLDSISKILKNDLVDVEIKKRNQLLEQQKKEQEEKEKAEYNFPTQDEIWEIISELWIIRHASELKWNTGHPDYGIKEAVIQLFEKFGIYEITIKILLLNTPRVAHFALPTHDNTAIFLLSVPFIRNMDLTKLEIALLLFEDYLKLKEGYFVSYVQEKKLKEMSGKNYYQNPDFNLKISPVGSYLKNKVPANRA
jgi:hypothetical protein